MYAEHPALNCLVVLALVVLSWILIAAIAVLVWQNLPTR